MAVGRFLDALSAPTPDPGGGSLAALAVTLAAGLCLMTAGLSARHLPAAERLAEQARLLRDRAAPLAQADAEAYRAVLAALRARGTAAPGGPDQAAPDLPPGTSAPARQPPTPHLSPADATDAGRPAAPDNPPLAAALSQASVVPMEVAEIGAEVAAVAAAVAAGGYPAVRGDAITAALIAAAGSRAAAALVRINLAGAGGDARTARAERLAAEAARLAAEAEAGAR
jgi:formiminotetrahydrofolate cyclodeaminase